MQKAREKYLSDYPRSSEPHIAIHKATRGTAVMKISILLRPGFGSRNRERLLARSLISAVGLEGRSEAVNGEVLFQ
jgi:hypothetical protein